MKAPSKLAFYGTVALYAAYNVVWLIGTSFSFGPNDTRSEAEFLLLTFVGDLPLMWVIRRWPAVGGIVFLGVLVTDLVLAGHYHVLSPFSIGFWYSPKLIMAVIAYKLSKSRWTGKTSAEGE